MSDSGVRTRALRRFTRPVTMPRQTAVPVPAPARTQPLSAEDRESMRTEVHVLRRLHEALDGKYELMGRLGQGGMGAVYLATDLALGRRVAIKVMLPEHVANPETAERFRREARTVASLNHPNIIPVYAVHEADDLAYFVMRYVEGRTLDSILRRGGRLPPVLAQAVLGQVGRGLAYAHRHGVVHRDIKPANIMIDDDGWALIADFGIAKVQGAQNLTLAGTTIGTPTYMSPEQCSELEVTPASDQYALGVVAFELLTGRVPFQGSTIASVLKQQLFDPPPPLLDVYPDCPPALAHAVNRMLAKKPAERWPTVEDAVRGVCGALPVDGGEVRGAIAEAARSGQVPAVRPVPDVTTPITPMTAPVRTGARGPARRRRRWTRSLVGIGSGAVGTAMLALALFTLWGGPSERPAEATPAALEMGAGAGDSAAAAPVSALPDTAPATPAADTATVVREPAPPPPPAVTPATASVRNEREAAGVGTVLLGTRGLPAALYVNGEPLGAVSGLRSWPVQAGTVRISIRLEGCAPWDSTVTVEPDRELRIGYRSPRCSE